MPPRDRLSALKIEKFCDLLSHGGHNSGVEECVETGKQERTDYNGDQNLDTGVHVTFGFFVLDGALSANSEFIYFVLNVGQKLFHKLIPRSFLILLFYRLALEVEEFLDLLRYGGHNGGVEERIETGKQECTDNNGDQNLDTGIDVTFGTDVVDGTLSANCERVALFGDLVKKLFHLNYLILS